MADFKGFTNVESRMMELLGDGHPHRPDELHTCLWDREGPVSNVNIHISNLRKKLRPTGQDIICQQLDGRSHFRLVRLTASHARGGSDGGHGSA